MEIKWDSGLNPNEILLPSKLYNNSPLRFLQRIVNRSLPYFSIKLGRRERKVAVRVTETEQITLSPFLFQNINIPTSIPYEIDLTYNSLRLGPVIAILVSQKKISLKKREAFKQYLQDYNSINGLVYLCSSSDFNLVRKTVQGYYYVPSVSNETGKWVRGVFPYPSVLYRRVRLGADLHNHLASQGVKIFNGIQLNKWSLWAHFQHDPQLRIHLPYTAQLNQENCQKIFEQYRLAYIKPIHRGAGKGIRMVEKKEDGYLMKNRNNKVTLCRTEDELYSLLQPLIVKGNNIVQQGIPYQYENAKVDFRVIMQKNRIGSWGCTGNIARFGQEGFICTNAAKALERGQKALQKIFQLTEQEAKLKEQEIINVCTIFCNKLDNLWGGYADIGIDVMLDEHGHVWVLEINTLHQHIMAKGILDNNQLYHQVISQQLHYAKALAGDS